MLFGTFSLVKVCTKSLLHVNKHNKLARYWFNVIVTTFLIIFDEIWTLAGIISTRICLFDNTISFQNNHRDREANIQQLYYIYANKNRDR